MIKYGYWCLHPALPQFSHVGGEDDNQTPDSFLFYSQHWFCDPGQVTQAENIISPSPRGKQKQPETTKCSLMFRSLLPRSIFPVCSGRIGQICPWIAEWYLAWWNRFSQQGSGALLEQLGLSMESNNKCQFSLWKESNEKMWQTIFSWAIKGELSYQRI